MRWWEPDAHETPAGRSRIFEHISLKLWATPELLLEVRRVLASATPAGQAVFDPQAFRSDRARELAEA